ncbi:acyltransferase domain-containing protein [Streptomyces sp. NPDC051940]|uniref:acyltransferase domain-containing protein n=1 Tax=Streptomyces sp. NPDC051940 TaxID=3155675 RepID=UPI003434341F
METVAVPDGPELLRLLEVPESEDAEIARVLAQLAGLPAYERAVADLSAAVGGPGPYDPGPAPAEAGEEARRWFHFCVFLGAVPAVRAHHRGLGVPDDVSWASLADLGNKADVHRRTHGTGGMDKQSWMTLPFRGLLYRLGRLQFDMYDGEDGWELGVHIPEGGPLDPEECEESYRRAREFFPRYFPRWYAPGEPVRMACVSWLLDPQLATYLPESSNIVRFQRRYELDGQREGGTAGVLTNADRDIVEFVFRREVATPQDVARLQARTTLERAVVGHIGRGEHWQVVTGRLRVGAAESG